MFKVMRLGGRRLGSDERPYFWQVCDVPQYLEVDYLTFTALWLEHLAHLVTDNTFIFIYMH